MSYIASVLDNLFSMFDSGATVDEIHENSMWSLSMILAAYDMWKAERGEKPNESDKR